MNGKNTISPHLPKHYLKYEHDDDLSHEGIQKLDDAGIATLHSILQAPVKALRQTFSTNSTSGNYASRIDTNIWKKVYDNANSSGRSLKESSPTFAELLGPIDLLTELQRTDLSDGAREALRKAFYTTWLKDHSCLEESRQKFRCLEQKPSYNFPRANDIKKLSAQDRAYFYDTAKYCLIHYAGIIPEHVNTACANIYIEALISFNEEILFNALLVMYTHQHDIKNKVLRFFLVNLNISCASGLRFIAHLSLLLRNLDRANLPNDKAMSAYYSAASRYIGALGFKQYPGHLQLPRATHPILVVQILGRNSGTVCDNFDWAETLIYLLAHPIRFEEKHLTRVISLVPPSVEMLKRVLGDSGFCANERSARTSRLLDLIAVLPNLNAWRQCLIRVPEISELVKASMPEEQSELKADVSELTATMRDMMAQQKALAAEVAALTSTVAGLRSEVADLKKQSPANPSHKGDAAPPRQRASSTGSLFITQRRNRRAS